MNVSMLTVECLKENYNQKGEVEFLLILCVQKFKISICIMILAYSFKCVVLFTFLMD